jgi:deoxyribonuclease V
MSAQVPEIPDMVRHLGDLLAQIPVGRVTTCGALAEALGNSIAARWVGHYMAHHVHSADCPCHRVVRAGGLLGAYIAGSPEEKGRRLRREGVEVRQGMVELERFAHSSFVSSRPLEQLQQVQQAIVAQIRLRPPRRIPPFIGGVDVSYPHPQEGVAAYTLVETDTGQLVWSKTVRRRVEFPYITTYLTFRELPILVELLDEVRRAKQTASVLLVDGTGILHHRGAGIATHFGVVADVPTIGVTKKLLCGQVATESMQPGESRPVLLEGRLAGVALRPTAGSRRPLFISPGHRVNLTFAEQVVRRTLLGRRLPEPLYWADRLSRAAGR